MNPYYIYDSQNSIEYAAINVKIDYGAVLLGIN